MTCALCEKPEDLRKSHIIPEFVYAPLYDGHHRTIGIHGRGRLRRQIVKKGLREPLLCDSCEQFLNDNYEKPFKEYWFDKKPLPPYLPPHGVVLTGIDYTSFKLFHLSVLFRCGVATLPTFSDVQLGPHENRLRDLIRNKNPGQTDEYPILAVAIIDKDNTPVWRIISKPYRTKHDGHNAYGILFGGCAWFYVVSSHCSHDIMEVSLKPNGALHLIPERWESFDVLQEASHLLGNGVV